MKLYIKLAIEILALWKLEIITNCNIQLSHVVLTHILVHDQWHHHHFHGQFHEELAFYLHYDLPLSLFSMFATLSTISYHHNKHVIVLFLLIITNIMCVCVRGGLGVFAFHWFIGRGCLPQQWSLKTRLLQFPVFILSFTL